MEQEQNPRAMIKVAGLLTDRLKEIWGNFMEEFQQSFDLDQLDLVFSVLKELESSSQNTIKKKRSEIMQRGDNNDNGNSASLEKKVFGNHLLAKSMFQFLSDTDLLSSFMEEFQQPFDLNQLDLVFSVLKELESSSQNHESSLEKKVFGNHLLAKSVFKCLSNTDLLSCRLINSYWNEYATEMLLKRDLQITFTRRTSTNRFYEEGESYENISNWRNLDMFTQLLRTSKQFPSNKFAFWGGNLGNDDAQRFFSFYGSSIKSIEISFYDEDREEDLDKSEDGFSVAPTESRIIGMILSHHLPNLEHLALDHVFEEENDWPGFKFLLFPPDKQIVLPNLKTVIYRVDQDFLRQLLRAAVNLKLFEFQNTYFEMDYLDLFIEAGKIKSISHLNFCAKPELNELEKIVEHGLELKLLDLSELNNVYKNPELWGKISTVLSKVLHSSKNSLDEICSFYNLGFLPRLQLPVVENVTELKLKVMKESAFNPQDIHDYSFAFLPRGATFSKNFPRLNSVKLNFESEISNDDASAWWKKCFPIDEIVPTVKELDVKYSCPILWMEKFCEMFPNLETLSVSKIKDFPNFSKIIWTQYTKLKNLTVEIDLSSPLNSRPFIIDSSFTGISPEKCKTLEKQSLTTLEQIGDNFRDNPSISNLKDLQTLNINFLPKCELDSTNFLTQISGPCAFNLLENLKGVNIFVYFVMDKNVLSKIKKSMEPLKAYKVNIK